VRIDRNLQGSENCEMLGSRVLRKNLEIFQISCTAWRYEVCR